MNLRKVAVVVAGILLIGGSLFGRAAFGRTWSDGLARTITVGSETMRYRLYLPAGYTTTKEYPLVLFLHGAGESGTNNSSQVSNHISNLINLTESQYPSILVAPQLRQSTGWYPEGNPQDLTPAMLQTLFSSYSIDDNRLYITGLSMGGFGTMNYLDYYTDRTGIEFAAAVSMHGGYSTTVNPAWVEHFKHVPTWLIHGNNDTVVSVNYSRNTYRSLVNIPASSPIVFNQTIMGYPTAVTGNIRYSEIPGGGHGGWTGLYGQTAIYNWMFAQAVPEPGTIALGLIGIVGLACAARSARAGKTKRANRAVVRGALS
jgi:predicted peptidase